MAKPARRFLTGYKRLGARTVWGRRSHLPESDSDYRIEDYCDRMTMAEARKSLSSFPASGAVIFELVPVED